MLLNLSLIILSKLIVSDPIYFDPIYFQGSNTKQEKILDALFGESGDNVMANQQQGIINGVHVGGKTNVENYPDIRYALTQLGFVGGAPNSRGTITAVAGDMPSVSNVSGHQDHFHIYFQPPKMQSIDTGAHLLVADVSSNVIAPQNITPSIVKQFNKDYKDLCMSAEHPKHHPEGHQVIEAGFDPVRDVAEWLDGFYNIAPKNSGQVKVLQQPKHGKLVSSIYNEPIRAAHKLNTQYDLTTTSFKYVPDNSFKYDPKQDILGEDRVKFEVTLNNKKFVLSYVIKVVGIQGRECQGSNDELANNNFNIEIDMEEISEDITDLASIFNPKSLTKDTLDAYVAELAGTTYSFSLLGSPNITFRDLTGSAVGETVGEGANAVITLDTDTAGHGWYIGGLTTEDRGQVRRTQDGGQATELGMLSSVFSHQSSDWLPTSNPNEWVARAGTAAAGKMDMLSVLLHEYGHALGIDHSSDSHDYMATTLTPGMRRLPSSDDMQLMAQLAGEAREAILAGNGYTLTVANSKDTFTANTFTANTFTPLPSPLPQGARGLNSERSEQDVPTLPINMGFGISFLGLLRRHSPRPLAGEGLGERGNVAQYNIAANTTLTNGNFNTLLPMREGQG